jgi:anti-anti-sigma regulatory factor
MTHEIRDQLLTITRTHPSEMIVEWSKFFDEEEKETQSRYYDDFLGFFEECIQEGLDIHSDSAQTMTLFLTRLYEKIGEEYFFNFHNSVYSCYLKFPIFHILDIQNAFHYPVAHAITSFFESMTSRIMLSNLHNKREMVLSTTRELEEREAPLSEISDGVLMVTIVGTLDSNRVLMIIDKVLKRLEGDEISHVIVEINAIYDMNSEIANQIIKLSNAIHFMGSMAYISGVNANIAKSLTHLGISLGDVKTFSTTKAAMKHISAHTLKH